MKYVILSLMMMIATGCGKCNSVKVTEVIPALSTPDNVYNGPCASTFNPVPTQYEVRWNDGSVSCWGAENVVGPAGHINVGDGQNFCNATDSGSFHGYGS